MKAEVIMRNETDLESVKNVAKSLLRVPILETEYSPMIVSHPFTKCGIVTLLNGEEFCQLDITKNSDALKKWQAQISKQIDESRNAHFVYYLLNDSYRLMFLNDIAKYLSIEDFSDLLGDAWVTSDYANLDRNVSKQQLLKLFKSADKSKLMSEDELETFYDFDDEIVVYRGVGSINKNNIKALSWTTSFGKAKWFSERWGKGGKIYSATIDKENILAFFDRKNEDEVIVDFNKLQNIKPTTKPESPTQKNTKSME
jgi:hypothetical protein